MTASAKRDGTTALVRDCDRVAQRIKALGNEFGLKYINRRARIVAEFHDQPFGHSKPNLRNRIFTIRRVTADAYGVAFELQGVRCLLSPKQIVLIVERT